MRNTERHNFPPVIVALHLHSVIPAFSGRLMLCRNTLGCVQLTVQLIWSLDAVALPSLVSCVLSSRPGKSTQSDLNRHKVNRIHVKLTECQSTRLISFKTVAPFIILNGGIATVPVRLIFYAAFKSILQPPWR